MSLITPPPPHIAKDLQDRDLIVNPVLAAQGLRQTRGSEEYPRGRTVRLTIKGVLYIVRVVRA